MSVDSLPVYILAKLFILVFFKVSMTCKIYGVNFYPLVEWLSGWQNGNTVPKYGKLR